MKTKTMDDSEIRLRGIEALNKSLGATAALKFLTMLHHGTTDYVNISKRIYKNQTIDEIFGRARKNWKG